MKTVLLLVFDGFADMDVAKALVRIEKEKLGDLKLISATLDHVTSRGGLRVLPDVDFILPDLQDIDVCNTAMLVLPGGSAWEDRRNAFFEPLIHHCMKMNIPVLALSDAAVHFASLEVMDRCGRHDYQVETQANHRSIRELTV